VVNWTVIGDPLSSVSNVKYESNTFPCTAVKVNAGSATPTWNKCKLVGVCLFPLESVQLIVHPTEALTAPLTEITIATLYNPADLGGMNVRTLESAPSSVFWNVIA
jgi:hypothetical protein